MLENLNLADIKERALMYQQKYRRIRNRALVLLLAVIVIAWLWIPAKQRESKFFHFADGTWSEFKDGFAVPRDVQPAPDGSYWVLTAAMSRFEPDRDYSKAYLSRSLGEEANYFETGITLRGDELMTAGGNSVAYFDGAEWNVFDNVLPFDNPVTLAFGRFASVIASENGEFALLDYAVAEWQPMTAPADFSGMPSLLTDNDGRIWLAGNGLWQLGSAHQWTDVLPEGIPANDLRLMGTATQTILLSTPDGLSVIHPDTLEQYTFSFEALGVPPGTSLNQSVEYGQMIYMATDAGLFTLTAGDTTWKPFTAVPSLLPILKVSVDGSGEIWVSASLHPEERAQAELAQLLASLGIICLLILMVTAWFFPRLYIQRERGERSQKLILSLLPDIPDYAGIFKPGANIRWGWLVAVAVPVMLAVIELAPKAGIGFPFDISLAFLIYLGITWLPLHRQMQDKSVSDESRALVGRNMRLVLPMLVIFTVVLFAGTIGVGLLAFFIIQDMLLASVTGLIVGFIAALHAAGYVIARPYQRIAKGALARGDYAEAQQQMEALHAKKPRFVQSLLTYGYVVSYAGWHEQAKTFHKQAITEIQGAVSPVLMSLTLRRYASSLDALQEYDEAERFYTAALDILPEANAPYLQLAYHILERGGSPEKALEVIEAMPQPLDKLFSNTPFDYVLTRRCNRASSLAIKAYVLAKNGRGAEAEALIQKAFDVVEQWFKPGLAHIHYLAGRTKQAMGDTESARTFYGKTAEIDPNGAARQKALKALETQ